MRGEDKTAAGQLHNGRTDAIRHRLDKCRMSRKWPDFDDFRRSLTHRRTGARNILGILTAAGIGPEGGRDKRDGIANPVVAHLADGIGQHRMPVAIAPIDRDLDDFLQRGNQSPVLIVNRAAAIEMIIMFRHFEQPFARNIAPAQNIF